MTPEEHQGYTNAVLQRDALRLSVLELSADLEAAKADGDSVQNMLNHALDEIEAAKAYNEQLIEEGANNLGLVKERNDLRSQVDSLNVGFNNCQKERDALQSKVDNLEPYERAVKFLAAQPVAPQQEQNMSKITIDRSVLVNAIAELDGGYYTNLVVIFEALLDAPEAQPVAQPASRLQKRDIGEFGPDRVHSTYFRGLGWNEAIDAIAVAQPAPFNEANASLWLNRNKLEAHKVMAQPVAQPAEPVGINGLTEAETSASMSVRGLSKPTAQPVAPQQEKK